MGLHIALTRASDSKQSTTMTDVLCDLENKVQDIILDLFVLDDYQVDDISCFIVSRRIFAAW